MLIHAKKRWLTAINAYLWPFAMCMANDLINETPRLVVKRPKHQGVTLLELFTVTKVAPNVKHWNTFGCPVYVLDNSLQAGKKIEKWQVRTRVGIYLGHSPQHACTVTLVLNKDTGLVSPQFHVKFDPSFQTMRRSFE